MGCLCIILNGANFEENHRGSAGASDEDFEPEEGQIDVTLAHALERIVTVVAAKRGYRLSGHSGLHSNNLNYSYAEKHSL